MRGEDEIRRSPQRIITRKRFGVGDVESCTPQTPIHERCGERWLVDEFAATDVDEQAVGAERVEHFSGHDARRVGCEWQRNDHYIVVGRDLSQFRERLDGVRLITVCCSSNDGRFHAERIRETGDLLADRTPTDHCDAAAGEFNPTMPVPFRSVL